MKLSKSEEEVISILWKKKNAYLKDILDAYADPKPAPSTVATLLKRMIDKGYVSYETHGSSRCYKALVSKKKFFKDHLSELKRKFFDNSNRQLASFFAKESSFTKKQLEELKSIIEQEIKAKDE
jgi:predicted transcriptional regulator